MSTIVICWSLQQVRAEAASLPKKIQEPMEKITLPSFRFPPSSRIVLAGPTLSGKSHLCRRLLRFRAELFSSKHPTEDDVLLVFYGVEDRPAHQELRKMFKTAEFHKNLTQLEEILDQYNEAAKSRQIYVLIEDLMLKTKNSEALIQSFLAYSHHLPCNLIFTIQSLFHKNSNLGLLLRNASSIILTGSPRLRSSLVSFGREINPSQPKELLTVFDACIEKSDSNECYPYLVINLLRRDANQGMYCTNLLPGENLKIFMIRNDN